MVLEGPRKGDKSRRGHEARADVVKFGSQYLGVGGNVWKKRRLQAGISLPVTRRVQQQHRVSGAGP